MNDTTPKIIDCADISFRWPGNEFDTLKISEFALNQGERLFLRGPSGSGKSTLLAILGGVIVPQQGRVTCCGHDLTQLRGAKRDRLRADSMGFIFQQFNLLPFLTVTENVLLPCRYSKQRAKVAGASEQELVNEAHRLLSALGIEQSLFKKRARETSVGQQQRIAAARALIGKPALLIADEPTSSLDSDTRISFIELLMNEAEASGASTVFVSHDRSLENEFDRSIDLPTINHASSKAA